MSSAGLPLREALERQPYDDLVVIGRSWGVEFRGTPPRKLLAEHVAKAMLNPGTLSPRVTSMPDAVQKAQSALLQAGSMRRSEFERRFGRIEQHAGNGLPYPPEMTPGGALHATGFALLSRDERGAEHVVIPADLAGAITSVLTSTFETLVRRHGAPPASRLVDEADRIVPLTATVLAFALSRGIQRTKSGDVNKVYLNKLTDHVYGKGSKDSPTSLGPHPLTLFSLLTLAGVIRSRGESAIELVEEGRSFVAASRLDQLRSLFVGWRAAGAQSVWCYPDVLPADFYGGWRLEADSDARNIAVDVLAKLPVGEWVEIDDVALGRMLPPPPKSLLNPYILQYFSWRQHTGIEAIQQYTVELIRDTLAWELAAFGAVRVDSESRATGTPLVLCLTELGGWLVGTGPAPQLPEAAPVVIQPSYEVLVPREAALEAIVAVDSFGELVRRDVVSTYRLTKAALVGAVERGLTNERVASLLESASGRPLPTNVARALGDWAASYGRIRVAHGPLLIADSAPLLAELQSNKKLSSMVGETLGDRVAEIAPRNASAVVKKLRELGHAPLVDPEVQAELTGAASRQRWEYAPAQFDGEELTALFVATEFILSLPASREGLPGGDDFLDFLDDLRNKIYDLAPARARRTMDQMATQLDGVIAGLESDAEADGEEWPDDASPEAGARSLHLVADTPRGRKKS